MKERDRTRGKGMEMEGKKKREETEGDEEAATPSLNSLIHLLDFMLMNYVIMYSDRE